MSRHKCMRCASQHMTPNYWLHLKWSKKRRCRVIYWRHRQIYKKISMIPFQWDWKLRVPANTSFGWLSARFGMRFSPMPRATRNHACSNSTSAMSAEYSTKSSQFFSIWKRVLVVAVRQFIPIDYSTISIACEHCCIQKQSNSNQLSLHSPSIWFMHSNWNFYVFNIVFSQFVIIETICCILARCTPKTLKKM